MKENKEIHEILGKLLLKKRYEKIDQDKLISIFNGLEFNAPSFDCQAGLSEFKKKILETVPEKSSKINDYFKGWRLSAAAVCFAVIAAVAVFLHPWDNIRMGRGATCTFVFGDAVVKRDSGSGLLKMGEAINDNDIIVTGDRSFADLTFRGEVNIRIKEKTSMQISKLLKTGNSNLLCDIELFKGKALLDFKKLSRWDNANIKTPTSVAGIRGTRFGIMVTEDKSVRYEVSQGKISVKNRLVFNAQTMKHSGSGEIISRAEKYIDENAVTVGENEVCEIDRKVQARVQNEVAKLIESSTPTKASAGIEEKLKSVISAAASPRVYSKGSIETTMLSELKDFNEVISVKNNREKFFEIQITSLPDNAQIYVDGEQKGPGFALVVCTKGMHSFRASAQGYADKTLDIKIDGSREKIIIDLDRIENTEFNYQLWLSRAASSYLVANNKIPVFINVSKDGRLEAVSMGKLKWSYNCGSPVNSHPSPDEKNLYITTAGEKIIALSLREGKLLWSRHINGILYFGARLSIGENHIYAATTRGYLYKINKNGNVELELRLPGGIYSSLALSGHLLFVPVQDGYIYVMDINNYETVMKINTGKIVGSSPIVRKNMLYTANFNGEVICYNYAKERVEWSFNAENKIVSDLLVVDNHIYITAVNGDIIKLTHDGHKVWRMNIGSTIDRNSAFEGANLYVLSRDVFYVIDMDNGIIKWSYVISSGASTNIAFMNGGVYFGTEGKGIISLKK